MLLNCPTCARSYTVSSAELGASGRTVICPSCQTHWHAPNPAAIPDASNDDLHKASTGRSAKTARQLAAGASASRGHLVSHLRIGLAVTVCAIVAITLVSRREWVVRHAPRTASIYAKLGLNVNVRGLTFAKLAPLRLASSDVTVGGAIRNVTKHKVTVPRIAYEVRDAIGTPLLSWSEAPASKTLEPGKTLDFESSPHHMPADSRTVTVRFVSNDAIWTRRKIPDSTGN